MCTVAEKIEEASAQASKGDTARVAAVKVQVEQQDGPLTVDAIIAAMAEKFVTRKDKEKSSKPSGKKKNKKIEGVTCFYWIKPGRYASSCSARDDRGKGKWRPTIRCAVMSETDFYRLSEDEKNKGKRQRKVETHNQMCGHVRNRLLQTL